MAKTKIQQDSVKKKRRAGLTRAGLGRPKGALNKNTRLLKDAILAAGENAGGKEGLVGYLTEQAKKNPGPFMNLVGKVLPMQLANAEGEDEFVVTVKTFVVKD